MNTAKKTRLFIGNLLALSLLFSASALATMTKSDASRTLQEAFTTRNLNIDIKHVEDSPMEGYYQIITDRGIFYIDRIGQYIFSGSVLSVADNLKNLTQIRLRVEHKKALDDVKHKFVTYRAPDEQHEILVFYDTTCGYCNKLHSEIAQYNALGITVHYAAYPRSGIVDPRTNQIAHATQQLASIWCADDDKKNQAFDMVIRNQPVSSPACEHGIEDQYQLGQLLGVSGTPAVFDMDANLVSNGYMPALAMLQRLEDVNS